MIDFFGHVAYAAVLAGMILLTRQNIHGWLVKALGDGGWVVLGIAMGMSSIIIWGAFFVLLDIVGYARWCQENKPKPSNPDDYTLGRGVLMSTDENGKWQPDGACINLAPEQTKCKREYWHGPTEEIVRCGDYSKALGCNWLCTNHYRTTKRL